MSVLVDMFGDRETQGEVEGERREDRLGSTDAWLSWTSRVAGRLVEARLCLRRCLETKQQNVQVNRRGVVGRARQQVKGSLLRTLQRRESGGRNASFLGRPNSNSDRQKEAAIYSALASTASMFSRGSKFSRSANLNNHCMGSQTNPTRPAVCQPSSAC